MQTDHLRFILEIARQGSINKAAEALHIPRTHLSRVLANLENDLGITIFQRLPRGVRPTEEGIYILSRSEEALTILDEMTTHFQDQTPKTYPNYHDRITFYCPSHMRSRGLVGQVIEEWQEIFPNTALIQKNQKPQSLAESLLSQPASLALAIHAPELNGIDWLHTEGLHFIPFKQVNVVALAAENHPLATSKSVSLKTLCQERLVLISQDDDEPPAFFRLLQQYGAPNVKQIITGNMSLFHEMIASGRYVSIGTPNTTFKDGLIEIPIKEKYIITGGLLFAPDALNLFPLRTLAEMIRTHFGVTENISVFSK